MAVELIFQGFRDELTKRGDAILSEMDNVLRGAYIEDFDKLAESLKAEMIKRLESAVRLATSEFLSSTGSIRSRINHPNMPSETALSEHVEKLKPKWLAKVDLIRENLRATQTPRLFLKRGEVFAGNRAARAIFQSAKKSLDIIDTYFGPEVFDLLEVTQQSVKIRLISDKANNPTKRAYHLLNQQYGQRVDFRLCDPKDIHDRFIIVDGQSALHVGASIKDLGRSDSLICHAHRLDITQVHDLYLALVKGSCFFRSIKALFHHLCHVVPPSQLLQ
jgi:hypothetical protein